MKQRCRRAAQCTKFCLFPGVTIIYEATQIWTIKLRFGFWSVPAVLNPYFISEFKKFLLKQKAIFKSRGTHKNMAPFGDFVISSAWNRMPA